jgi:hypothetical protein
MSGILNLDDTILRIRMEYGEIARSKKWDSEYYNVPISRRLEAFTALVRLIKDFYGKPADYFTNFTRGKIVSEFIPHKNSVKNYNGWRQGAISHLNIAIMTVYSDDSLTDLEAGTPSVEAQAEILITGNPLIKIFDPTKLEHPMEPRLPRIKNMEMAELLGIEDDE